MFPYDHYYRSVLETSLDQCKYLVANMEKAEIPIVWHGRVADEPAPCCHNCLEEVFNILFVLTQKGEYLVYCYRCAVAMRKSFTVLLQVNSMRLSSVLYLESVSPPFSLHSLPLLHTQYRIEELEATLSSFRVHQPGYIHST